jgi:anti-sigma regulatory factor (Ser/Thr protein kinase)
MIETTLPNRREAMPRVVELVDALLDEHGVSSGVRADIQVALDEAIVNVIENAWPDDPAGEHAIRVTLGVADGMFEATVEDDGVAFDPLGRPAPALGGTLDERTPGGLGIHFIRQLMTEVRYARAAGRNMLTMRRSLDAGDAGGGR